MLEDYLKAVDLLTINSDKLILQKQVLELKEKSKDSEYIIKAKLEEKNVEIENMKGANSFNAASTKGNSRFTKRPCKVARSIKGELNEIDTYNKFTYQVL